MAGTSRLLVIVEVAFGAGALDTGTLTWTDISSHVKLTRGIECSRGVDTETGGPMPGRLTFAVNNDAGDFTPGKTGAFGLIRNRLPVRVRTVVGSGTGIPLAYDSPFAFDFDTGYDDTEVGSVVVWTGLVETWKIGWTAGVRSQVDVTCVDRWAALRRLKFDGHFIERVVTGQTPTHFWPLTAEYVTAPDRIGSALGSQYDLTSRWSPPGCFLIEPPSGNNPQSWLNQAGDFVATTKANPASIVSDTKYPALFISPGAASFLPTGAASVAFTFSGWVKKARLVIATGAMVLSNYSATLGVDNAGFCYAHVNRTGTAGTDIVKSTTVNADQWHHVALTLSVDGSGAVTFVAYVDGVSIGSDTTTWTSGGWTLDCEMFGVQAVQNAQPVGMAYAAVWHRALTPAEILAQYQAGVSQGVVGDTAAVRAARLTGIATQPVPVATTGTFTSTMSKQDLVDKSFGDALAECATAEAGQLFIGTDGWPNLTSRAWRTAAALAFTIPAHALSTDTSWTLDDQQLVNSATVDRMVGDQTAATVTARNDDSVETYGEQTTSVSLYVDSDAQLLERANAEANMFATATPRSSDLTVDLITKAATISPATLLAADVGSRIAVSGMPTEAPTQTQFYVAAIADKITHTGWERTFTVSPRLDWWTLQDATSGQLDSTFVLAF